MASAIGTALISAILPPMVYLAMDKAKAIVVNKVDGNIVNIQRDISKLLTTLSMIEGIVQVAEEKHIDNVFIRNWLRGLVDVAYESRDVLDDFITFSSCIIGYETSNPVNFISSFMLSYFGGSSSDTSKHPLTILNRLEKDIRIVRERFDEKKKEGETFATLKFMLGEGSESVKNRRPEVGPFINKQRDGLLLGREEVKQEIMEKILHPSDDNRVHVVTIWGMGGIGKTTLAQSIYNDERVQEVSKSWLGVGEEKLSAEKVIREIVNDQNTTGIGKLQEKLVKELSGDRFLIVLDDVWDVDRSGWDSLFNPLTYVGKGGLIIITTRCREVCNEITIQTAYDLKPLSEEDSWSIFESCAYVNGKSNSTLDLKGIGKQIVKKLNGLPLALKVVGRSLLNKDFSTWTCFLESKFSKDDEVMSALRWSYNHLPPHLKVCFAYLSLFPKVHVFDNENVLVEMWMAHDLIQTEEQERPEAVGAKYFKELVNASLLQSCDDGKYVMHDLIHDLALLVSNGEFASTISSSLTNDQMNKVCHITITPDDYLEILNLCKIEKLLTLYTTSNQINTTEMFDYYVLDHVFKQLKSIRVLVLCNKGIKEIPDCISELRHLRYLDVSQTGVRRLPDSLCRLYNLQMLAAPRDAELPIDIVNMVNLRYVKACLSTCKGVRKLKSLQELSSISVCQGDNIRELGDMQILYGRLSIKGLQNVTSLEDAANAMMKKQKCIDELELVFDNQSEESTISEEVLDAFGCPPNLICLKIYGYPGVKPPSWMVDGTHKFHKLHTLELSNCPKLEYLPPLGELKYLKHPYFHKLSSLKNLRITDCPQLQSSPSDFHKLSSLEELHIKSCPQLQLPPDFHKFCSFVDYRYDEKEDKEEDNHSDDDLPHHSRSGSQLLATKIMAFATGTAMICTILQVMAVKAMDIMKGNAIDKVVDKVDGIVNMERDISNLQITLRMIQAIVQVAEEKQIHDDLIRNWLRDLVDIGYEARDVLDDFITFSSCIIGYETSNPVSFISSFRLSYFGGLSSDTSKHPLTILNRLEKDIRIVRERFDEKKNEGETFATLKFMLGEGSESVKNRRPEVGTFINKQRDGLFLGREEVKQEIMEKILHPSDDNRVHVVTIWGMGGIGKTTLAQSIYNDERVQEVSRSWLGVGEKKLSAEKVIRAIVNDQNTIGIEKLQEKFVKELSGDRFLIVLDDVWDVDRSEWDSLFNPLTYVGKGGLIIITTRCREVCNEITIQTTYNLEPLSEEDSWSIFESYAYVDGKANSTSELKHNGEEIVKKLNGLPKALKVVGCSLLNKNYSTSTNILESNEWMLIDDDNEVMSALRWSYNHLPRHLKMCFTYYSLFPKDHVLDKKLLVQMWMAHDLIQKEEKERPEDVGAQYFEQLVNASLLQIVDGKYVMHDLTHDLALLVSNGEFATANNSLPIDQMEIVRHITITPDDYSKIPHLCKMEKLLTLYTICSDEKYTNLFDDSILEDVLKQPKSIRVLVLCSKHIKTIPDCISELKHLRYLDVSQTGVRRLPDSLCRLYNLQMLAAPCDAELPIDIVNMVNLRYVKASLSTCKGVGKLTSLQELSSIRVCQNDNIRELGDMQILYGRLSIEGLQNVTSSKDAAGALMEKQKCIDELELVFDKQLEESTISEEVLDAFGCPPNLICLKIYGYPGVKPSSWMVDGMHKFHILELSNCPKLEYLPPLGELTSLKHPDFHKLSSLKSLHIYDCPQLQSLPPDFHKLTSLNTLKIVDCPQLQSLPSLGLPHSMESLELLNCPLLYERCKDESGIDWHKIKHIHKLTIWW